MTEMRRSYDFGFGLVDATVTSRGAVVDAWVRNVTTASQHLSQNVIVGLDCEWRPNNIQTTNNRAATLQLCVESRCIIIQLIHVDHIPASLLSFLERRNVVCVGVGVNEDVAKLRSYYGITVGRTEDLRDIALYSMPQRFIDRPRPGLKTLAQEVVGLYMPKPERVSRSDWQSQYLDDHQIEYACLDAYASCMIGKKLLAGRPGFGDVAERSRSSRSCCCVCAVLLTLYLIVVVFLSPSV